MLPDVTTLREPLTRSLGPKTAQALENGLRHAHGRRSAAALPAALLHPRRADRPVLAARRRPRHRAGPGGQRQPAPDAAGASAAAAARSIVTDDRAKLMLTFFFRRPGPSTASSALVPGMVGMFAGTVSSFRGRLPAGSPGVRAAARGAAQRRPDVRAGRRVRHRADPGLPGQRQGQLVDDRPSRCRPCSTRWTRGEDPLPERAAGAVRPVRPGRGHPGHPPPAGLGRPPACHRPAQMGRSVHAAVGAGPAPDGGRRPAGHAPAAHRRRASPTSSTPSCRSP